ncbi:hypothetical protein JOM56_008964 [Amanita muscaria]
MSSYSYEYDDGQIAASDIVAVRHGLKGRQEGLVVGSRSDYAGRQIIEVQLENEVYHAWQPQVTLVRRMVSYPGTPNRVKKIERRIYW